MNAVADFLVTCALAAVIVIAFVAVAILADRWRRFASPLTFPAWVWFEVRLWALAAVVPLMARQEQNRGPR